LSRSISLAQAAIHFMQILKRIGIILVWLAGPVFIFAAVNKNDPYLISLRGPGNIVLAAVSIIAVVVLIRRGYWRRGLREGLLILLWCLPSLSMLGAHASFEWRKRNVLQTEDWSGAKPRAALHRGILVIPGGGGSGRERLDLRRLRHQAQCRGSSSARLKEEILALQEKRRAVGLPPLIVAADQEGGIVSHLAPPLTKLPALSTLASLAPDIRAEKAGGVRAAHGQELAALGVNQNLAPVLDLRPEMKRNRLDFNTLIRYRAISDDPASSPISRGPTSTGWKRQASARR
jgi:beta-N-acetylhexosaminidase